MITITNETPVSGSSQSSAAPNIRVVSNSALPRFLWLFGWLFTMGFIQLTNWEKLFALFIWPYYIGDFVKSLI